MKFPRVVFSLFALSFPSAQSKTSSLSNSSAFAYLETGATGGVRVITSISGQSDSGDVQQNLHGYMSDSVYPGTAVERLFNVRARVRELTFEDLNGPWENIRRKILWAGGLRDIPSTRFIGQGYTGHSFNDFNHVDLTCMVDNVSNNENDGQVRGIAIGNQLGPGIRAASLPELGPGGSWSTCAMGCNKEPPQDVAHLQFRARIAFKLVWVPNDAFDTFVLVDDDGKLLAQGKPSMTEELPPMRERQLNYRLVAGSKYAREADKIARQVAAE